MLTSKRWPSHLEQHREVTGRGGVDLYIVGREGDIDAAPMCETYSVIVINNIGLAIWAQTGQFVCPE